MRLAALARPGFVTGALVAFVAWHNAGWVSAALLAAAVALVWKAAGECRELWP